MCVAGACSALHLLARCGEAYFLELLFLRRLPPPLGFCCSLSSRSRFSRGSSIVISPRSIAAARASAFIRRASIAFNKDA